MRPSKGRLAVFAALRRILTHVVEKGSLTVIDAGGRAHRFGDGTGIPVTVRLHDRRLHSQMLVDPELHFGEAYMNGRITVEGGTVYDALEVVLSNLENRPAPLWLELPCALRYLTRRIRQFNPMRRARRNVAHHYDLDARLYDLFLDRDRQYSCAYFETPQMSLEEAQLAKKRHLVAKLAIEPGMRVLDIGSGWGGLGLYLAEATGARVVGVTLSEEQLRCANGRARQRGVADRVEFRLQDYRQLDERFDRIVSVGMFEHVGLAHYRRFFAGVQRLLADDGVAVLHSIGRAGGPGVTNPFIAKYIFPGGYVPALSEVLPAIERAGLYVSDIEVLRMHYAQTLREWRIRFDHNRSRAAAIYDERFCRMWEFYLAASEASFRYWGMNNFQIQMVKDPRVLPLTRNYIDQNEERLRQIDRKRPRLKQVPAE
jgi:cyclopropane-fatty-acyl-phospholipid synthase